MENNKNIKLVIIIIVTLLICIIIGARACTYINISSIVEVTNTPKATDNTNESLEYNADETTQELSITQIVSSMTLEEKVGQMFFVRCPESDKIVPVRDYYVGGYILFARDFEAYSKQDVINTNQELQNASTRGLIIGVDEEGGTVTRVSKYSQFRDTKFASPRDLYAEGGMQRVIEDCEEKCNMLTSLGINVNLAPVCDISTNPDDYIYSRSVGLSAEETADFAIQMSNKMKEYNIGSVLKHFPGYGGNQDTHTGLSIDNRSLETLESCDIIPFKKAIEAGTPCILVSHNIINCMDDKMPSSLSVNAHNYLRETLNYDGVIITDDLAMDAISEYVDEDKVAIYAVQAGNDMIISTYYKPQIKSIINAVSKGEIDEETINQAVTRVLEWKKNLGILK